MASAGAKRLALVLTGFTFLTACEEGSEFKLFEKPLFEGESEGVDVSVPDGVGETTIERDVEAPEVFQQTDAGLWDGRPSLGGVWVAHPDVADPERVIIRNEANGKFVIGALFRRERENPGPRFQVSSDAASSLGMLAGAPSDLSVVALRREEVPILPQVEEVAAEAISEPTEIQETTLDPVAAMAESAIEAATTGATAVEAAPAIAAPAPAVAPKPKPASSLEKPFIQIGIFSIESNATNTAEMLRKEGVIPTIKKSSSNGKKYWRVVVGPAANAADRRALLEKVRGLGFSDAYAVTN